MLLLFFFLLSSFSFSGFLFLGFSPSVYQVFSSPSSLHPCVLFCALITPSAVHTFMSIVHSRSLSLSLSLLPRRAHPAIYFLNTVHPFHSDTLNALALTCSSHIHTHTSIHPHVKELCINTHTSTHTHTSISLSLIDLLHFLMSFYVLSLNRNKKQQQREFIKRTKYRNFIKKP